MFRTALWTLRQPRYAALAVLMFIIAGICIAAGTWQISRFQQSVHANDALKGNAHAAAVPLTTAVVPLVGAGPKPNEKSYRFRTVTVSGSYAAGPAQFVRDKSEGGKSGFYVLSPLSTSDGTLLVVRGFIAGHQSASGITVPPAVVATAPAGAVTVTGRLEAGSSTNDGVHELSNNELAAINPAEQATRLGAPVYAAYLTLIAHQPGTAGLRILPKPDLSNPAGGAYEGQHFAYIIQWYLFALLALAAPFAMGRSEVREARQRFLGLDPGNDEFDLQPINGDDDRLALGASGAVAVRERGTLARPGDRSPEQWERAAQLADRYGRSLGRGRAAGDQPPPPPDARRPNAPAAGNGHRLPAAVAPNSAERPHRSADAFQGSYNDYLWQLALADGAAPPVNPPDAGDVGDVGDSTAKDHEGT